MNTESIQCRKVAFGEMKSPGDFCFDEDFSHLYIWLPGQSHPDCIQIQKGAPGGPRVWGWDGNEDAPTTTPSIHAPDRWHGYLTAGRLVSC